jgi:predicted PurR-regulated permease PerM
VPSPRANFDNYQKVFVLTLVLIVASAFVAMIRHFLVAVLLAAIFTAMLYPVYTRVVLAFRGRRYLASVTVLVASVLVVGLPLLALLGVVAAEALHISKAVQPWVHQQLTENGGAGIRLPDWIPFAEELEPYKTGILAKLGEIAGSTGQFLVRSVSTVTRGTVGFILNAFVLLYAMFFFLVDGPAILQRVASYIPLSDDDRETILERGVGITRASLKGIFVIGVLQGVLVGIAFRVTGVDGAAFWGTVVMVLSAIPGLGAPLIWVPAVVYLWVTGQQGSAIGLLVWCVVVVSTVDNIIRPTIVGSEARMSDLLVLLSTLGGIALFGAVGIIIGPILAGVMLTTLEIYRRVFFELEPEPVLGRSGRKKASIRRRR